MKIYRYIYKLILILIFIVISINSIDYIEFSKASNNVIYDYSREDSLDTETINASDLLEIITGKELLLSEKNYLDTTDYLFKYENKIPSNSVSMSLNNDILTVHANEYKYVDINGNEITWIPYEVRLNTSSVLFQKDKDLYHAIITCVEENDEAVNVIYKAKFTLEHNLLNNILNESYNVAHYYVTNNIIENKVNEYKQLYQQFLEDKAAYEKYVLDMQQYEIDIVKYNNYLNELKGYNEKYSKYQNYLNELDKYNKEVELYNQYIIDIEEYNKNLLEYEKYLVEKEKYNKEYDEYLPALVKYENEIKYVNYALSVMELIRQPMTSMNRTVYNAVMGDSVTQVLARKDELYGVGVDKAIILQAENATYKLREIFNSYYSLNTDAEKYLFYKSNYTAIKNNLVNLLTALEHMYKNELIVRQVIAHFGKTPQYQILIAQLVLVCNAISKGDVKNYTGSYVFDNNWKIDGLSMNTVLENDYTFVDVDSLNFPIITLYPTKPVEPIKPNEVLYPTRPEEVSKPIAPTEVVKPIAPTEVVKPILPEEKKEPQEPVKYIPDPLIVSLIEDYNSNKLVKKEEYSESYELYLNSTFEKKFRNMTEVTVEFYDFNKNFISKYTTDMGSYISYDEKLPTKASDNIYKTYKFSHWEYEDKTILDLNNVVKEGFVYPVFVGDELQNYTVTWYVDKDVTTETYHYGELPIFKGDIDKKYSAYSYYTFTGWDKEITEVTSDVSYTAMYDKHYLIENENGNAIVNFTSDVVMINYVQLNTQSLDLSIFIREVVDSNFSQRVELVNNNSIIYLTNYQFLELVKNDLKVINVYVENQSKYEYEFKIELLNSNNEIIAEDIGLQVVFKGEFDTAKSTLYKVDENGDYDEIRCVIKTREVRIDSCYPNQCYIIYPIYNITLVSNDNIKITTEKTSVKYNELIKFNVEILSKGIYIQSINVQTLGNRIEVTDNSFLMPNDDVRITVDYEYYNYKITFISSGDIISEKNYTYGQEVELPPNPIKVSDDKYTYTFVGWDKEVVDATEDAIYIAVFDATEIIPIEEPSSFNLVTIALIIGGSVIGLTTIGVVLLILKKKKLLFFKQKS